MKIINLFGGPGSGKSTTAAGLFYLLKLKNYNVELVTEYAKDLVWENRLESLDDELYIFAKQQRRLRRLLKHKIEYIVTDSPLLKSLAFIPEGYFKSFSPIVEEISNSFENINIVLKRVKLYNPIGRLETEEQAKGIDLHLRNLLIKCKQEYHLVDGDSSAPNKILDILKDRCQDRHNEHHALTHQSTKTY